MNMNKLCIYICLLGASQSVFGAAPHSASVTIGFSGTPEDNQPIEEQLTVRYNNLDPSVVTMQDLARMIESDEQVKSRFGSGWVVTKFAPSPSLFIPNDKPIPRDGSCNWDDWEFFDMTLDSFGGFQDPGSPYVFTAEIVETPGYDIKG